MAEHLHPLLETAQKPAAGLRSGSVYPDIKDKLIPDGDNDVRFGLFGLDLTCGSVGSLYHDAGVIFQPLVDLLIKELHGSGVQLCKEGL